MLSGANRERCGALRTKLANQYGFGNDLYPKSIDQCLTMMNRRVDATPPCQKRGANSQQPPHNVNQEEEALVFAQGSDKPSPAKATSSPSKSSSSTSSGSRSGKKVKAVVCKNCGQQGHVSTVCPRKQPPPEQIHAMVPEPDDASVTSDDDSVLFLSQLGEAFFPTSDEVFLTHTSTPPPRRPISSDLVLLNCQSTVHLFSDPTHVANIRPAARPIRVHCNKGALETTQEADSLTMQIWIRRNIFPLPPRLFLLMLIIFFTFILTMPPHPSSSGSHC